MSEIRVDVYRSIPFEIGTVSRCLRDFERAQSRLFAGFVDDYAVLAGGIGEGTVVTCGVRLRGRTHTFAFRISEPIQTKIITAYDPASQLEVTWRLRAEGPDTEVEIKAYWSEPDSFSGLLTDWWASVVVRRMFNRVLSHLPAVIAELGYDNPPPSLAPL